MYDEIKNYNTSSIDGTVIANMLYFAYLCPCFKENKLIELRIGDIQYQDGQITEVTIKGGNGNPINEDITNRNGDLFKNLIREHVEYLRSKGYSTTADAPLFPGKRSAKYNQRTLQRHFETLREELKNDDITINYERHEAILNRYVELKQNKLKTNTECLEGAAEFGWCDESNVKKILAWRERREQAHSIYLQILNNLYPPSKNSNEDEVDEGKLIEQKTIFFTNIDKDKYIGKIMKEEYKNRFIEEYKKMGIEFNPDNTVTVNYTPTPKGTSVLTLKEYLRHYYRAASEDFIQQDSERILVKYLRHIGKVENYIALKLEEYLRHLGQVEDYIQNRFQELGVDKYNPQKSIQEKSVDEYTQEELDELLRKHTSLPKDPYAGQNNQFENEILQKLQQGRIIFFAGFSLE